MDKKLQLENQIKLQQVIQNELAQLKNTSKVYQKQQGSSDIFFLSSVDKEMQASKRTLDNLQKEYKSMEQADQEAHEKNSEIPR
jgi:hypothetical protein